MMHGLFKAKSCICANNSFDNVNHRVKPYCTELHTADQLSAKRPETSLRDAVNSMLSWVMVMLLFKTINLNFLNGNTSCQYVRRNVKGVLQLSVCRAR